MRYDEALKMVGAEVIDYARFGSPQGHWWARVAWQGREGWAHGYFGACPSCDVVDDEFGEFYRRRDDVPRRVDGRLAEPEEQCEGCGARSRRLMQLARERLDNLLAQGEAEDIAALSPGRAVDREETLVWLRAHALRRSPALQS